MITDPFLWIAPAIGAAAMVVAFFLRSMVVKAEPGNENMVKFQGYIKEGANAFIKRQYKTLSIFIIAFAVIIGIVFSVRPIALTGVDSSMVGVWMAIAYVCGCLGSAVAGLIGLSVGVSANSPTAWAAKKGLAAAFNVSFFGGAVMGLLVTGVGILGVWIFFFIFGDPSIILGFSFGASTISLFMKAGGGIFTKTADVGADLVGKIEFNLPEDDARNPAAVADNVGDNVGDIAGMGADLLDSYIASLVAAMLLCYSAFGANSIANETFATYPLIVSSAGLIASLVGILLIKFTVKDNPGGSLNMGTYIAAAAYAGISAAFVAIMAATAPPAAALNIYFIPRLWASWLAGILGVGVGILIGLTTDYFTDDKNAPTKATAESCQKGHAINILTGFSYGLNSVFPPMLGIVAALAISWAVDMQAAGPGADGAGVVGVANAAVGMLAIVCTIVSNDAYGPITDNSRSLAEQGGLEESVVAICDELDSAGNTAKAVTKGFAIGAAALTVLALLFSYTSEVGIEIPTVAISFDLLHAPVMIGVLIGAIIPPVYSGILIAAVDKNAEKMVDEIRRQFKEHPGILKGEEKADFARCVDIATAGALHELIIPAILSVAAPIGVGLVFGVNALGGFLASSIATGFVFGVLFGNAGGIWDNAKKYIEEGHFGGKGSPAHAAAVTGDTVGDPFKDTAGPSINTLITVMGLAATLFIPLFALVGDGLGLLGGLL
jgi:K(+)-stimulated pyrophosphate-energized sodium pump